MPNLTGKVVVTIEDGNKTAEAYFKTVTEVFVTEVKLNKTSVGIENTGTYNKEKLVVTLLPSNATNKNFQCASSDAAIATVDINTCEITAAAVGIAQITVTPMAGSGTATATVTVSEEWTPTNSMKPVLSAFPTGLSEIEFPMGAFLNPDGGKGVLKHKFEMGTYEVTYELWKKVFDWANKDGGTCDEASGKYCYKFNQAGAEGNAGTVGAAPTESNRHQPVTKITWHDAAIWLNALTEWSKATGKATYTTVYNKSGKPLRDATAVGDINAIAMPANGNFTQTGFRLPTSLEWEFAARLRKDSTYAVALSPSHNCNTGNPANCKSIVMGGTTYYFTKGDSAVGGTGVAGNNDSTRTIAWSYHNSCHNDDAGPSASGCTTGHRTHTVGKREANALGIFDMSGNVYEWCFDGGGTRMVRGNSYKEEATAWGNFQIVKFNNWPTTAAAEIGLRFVRTVE